MIKVVASEKENIFALPKTLLGKLPFALAEETLTPSFYTLPDRVVIEFIKPVTKKDPRRLRGFLAGLNFKTPFSFLAKDWNKWSEKIY
ncbi:MAG: hypothetical protein FJ044_03560 [Candidatus Cloacimonetes bacterium]|nr:hypothetical protein [Candidatus Cloacimonadota bacterium]